MRGKLIAFDGVDGCGKSTQVVLLSKVLQQKYPSLDIVITREPWDVEHNPIGKRIRSILTNKADRRVWADQSELNHESLQYLYFLDRCVHYMKLIIPSLEENKLVITDRERMVTYAYGLSTGVPVQVVSGWHDGMTAPDLYIFTKVSAETALLRLRKRNEANNTDADLWEKEDIVRKNVGNFEKVASLNIIKNLEVVDANKGMTETNDEILARVESALSDWLLQFKV